MKTSTPAVGSLAPEDWERIAEREQLIIDADDRETAFASASVRSELAAILGNDDGTAWRSIG